MPDLARPLVDKDVERRGGVAILATKTLEHSIIRFPRWKLLGNTTQ